MNKEVIKKYKAEFDYWLYGGELLWAVDTLKTWTKFTDEMWIESRTYIINDEYSELRKSAAKGRQMQVSYDEGLHWHDKSTRKITWSKNQLVRVKPQELVKSPPT